MLKAILWITQIIIASTIPQNVQVDLIPALNRKNREVANIDIVQVRLLMRKRVMNIINLKNNKEIKLIF